MAALCFHADAVAVGAHGIVYNAAEAAVQRDKIGYAAAIPLKQRFCALEVAQTLFAAYRRKDYGARADP